VQYFALEIAREARTFMIFHRRLALVALAAAAWLVCAPAFADKTTVCTITVNSSDEREVFRRYLPADRYQFVELVERGRPDWLASACRKGIRCDVLVISGHFDGGDEFYSDRVDARESLPVAEMERVSCGGSCPGLFSQLKEVYLFGCNTLNPDSLHAARDEIARSLVAAGHAPADVDALSQLLAARYADSNRDKMRAIFKDVPVIYGFSSKAPLGAKAGPMLERYFQAGEGPTIGSGQPSAKLLALFAPSSMTAASGVSDADAQAAYRRDLCTFVDDRATKAGRLAFVHTLLQRDMAEARLFLDPIERSLDALSESDRAAPAIAPVLAAISSDAAASTRYLAYLRNLGDTLLRTRMIDVASRLGWLTPAQRRAELTRMIDDRLRAADLGAADVEAVCRLNQRHEFDAFAPSLASASHRRTLAASAILACLGDRDAHRALLDALTSAPAPDVAIAQVYLRHHPIVDAGELRHVALRIGTMRDANAQVRVLDALADHPVSDAESLESLVRLFALAKNIGVQRAVAGVLIRSDYRAIAKPELVRALRDKRLKSPDGQDLIDILIRRMQASLGKAA
jgi:hypothetical protein